MTNLGVYGDPVRLIYLRKKKRLSMQEMADQIGVSRISISLIERGERRMSRDVLYRISDATMIEPAWLYGDMPLEPIAYVAGYVPPAQEEELSEPDAAALDFAVKKVVSASGVILGDTIGERIRSARLRKGLPIHKLAERIDRHYLAVFHYEHNDRRPSDKLLPVIARELGVSVHWLLTGEEELFPITKEVLEFLQEHPEVRKMLTERVEADNT